MTIFMFVNVDWFFLSHRLDIAKESKKRGVDMTVFTDFTSDHIEHAYGDFSFLQSPLTRKSSNLVSLCREFFKTLILIRNCRPNAVHAVTIKPIIFLGIICFILRIPFIASISGLGPVFSATGLMSRMRRRVVMLIYRIIFLPKATRVICQNQADANILIKSNLLSKYKLIMTEGSGVDVSKYEHKHSSNLQKIYVLMASRLLPDKGISEFCSAANIIIKNFKFEVEFQLAGPIDLESPGAFSKKEVDELCKTNNVQFLGNRTDLPEILSDTDIFVLPSYYAEGIPKVLLEAAASGCAVITTDHPGCRDAIVSEQTGLLVKPKDISSLTNALIRLLNDRSLRLSMGIAGRELALKKFSISKVIDIHYSLYFLSNTE